MLTKDDVATAKQALISLEAPRVWSMLVSIFGDLAFRAGDSIEGPLLTRLTDGMNIKPEAVRVALHRLRNDSWIVSTKSGRTANHALTANALAERNRVAPLIYNRTQDLPQDWCLAIPAQNDAEARTALGANGFVALSTRIFIGQAPSNAPKNVLLCAGETAPDWVRAELVPGTLTRQFDTLLTALQSVSRKVSAANAAELSPTEAALFRALIVHHWRRLVLRHPYLPVSLLGAHWPGHQCRTLVCDLLDAIPLPELDALAAEDRRVAL